MFLHFPSLLLLQIKLFFRRWVLAFFKIDRINMINTDQAKQKDTDVPSVDPKLFKQGVCIVNEASLIDRNTVLRVLILLDKSHRLQYLVEHDVVYFVVN